MAQDRCQVGRGGWGVFVDQQGTTAFAALFVSEGGRAGWYVMPEGKRQRDGAFAGALFRTSGPAASAAANARAVGSMRIAAEKGAASLLAYDIDGKAVTTPIQRQRFRIVCVLIPHALGCFAWSKKSLLSRTTNSI